MVKRKGKDLRCETKGEKEKVVDLELTEGVNKNAEVETAIIVVI